MQTKHTPGPWAHYPGDRYVRDPETDATIAFVCPDDGHCDEPQPMPWEANAHLMAAAPDLLAALEGLIAWGALARLIDKGIAESIAKDPVWKIARAAINKAKGGE